MKKRLIAIALVLALLLAAAPMAFAAETSAYLDAMPSGLAADGNSLLVTDLFNKVIWRVTGGKAELMAGKIAGVDASGVPAGACVDGSLTEARFMEPWAIAPFLEGWAVTDASANMVRYVSKDGVFTLAGTGKAGKEDGVGTKASFNYPTGLAADASGNLYVADTGNGLIRKISKEGRVTVFASGLNDPTGLCWASGVLYVAETGANRICRIVSGKLEVLCGGEEGFADGTGASAMLTAPQGVLAMSDGSLLIADTMNGAVRSFANGALTTVMASDSETVNLVNPRSLVVLLSGKVLVSDAFSGLINTVSSAASDFSDVSPDAWYAAAVAKATQLGLVTGDGNGKFAPGRTMSRAELVTVLMRLTLMQDQTQVLTGEASFSDVKDADWFCGAVQWAASSKIVTGDTDGRFRPNGAITRAELVTMLYRFAKASGQEEYSGTGEVLNGFADAKSVPAYARTAMAWACEKDILHGSDGKLLPGASATRAQAVQLLVGFAEQFVLK